MGFAAAPFMGNAVSVAASSAERPICAYGLIGNSRTAALISDQGSLDWCCLPRFDSDSLFCSLVDPDIGGRFSLSPAQAFRSRQAYVDETNVLATTFETEFGAAELLDCCSVTDEKTKRERLWPDNEILRCLRGIRGSIYMRLRYYPTIQYGLKGLSLSHRDKWGIVARWGHRFLALRTDLPPESIRIIENRDGRKEAVAEFVIREGSTYWFSLLFEDDEPALWVPLGAEAKERLDLTLQYWKNWIGRCHYCGPYEKQVRRSALTLKLLNFAPSGAMVAAPTTSLPEVIGGSRNWDYRYCWLRDASFTVRALCSLGYREEATSHVSWLLHSTRGTRNWRKPRLRVLYDVYGHSKLPERTLPWLRGYRRSRPVRVGNGASGQNQLDIYGEVIESLNIVTPFLQEIDHDTRNLVIDLGRAVLELWDKPDDGIWEPRSGARHHTHSKVLAWVALTRVSELAQRYHWRVRHDFLGTARKTREAIERHGYNREIGAYTMEFDGKELDAALLVLPSVGYCHPLSPRFQGTLAAIARELEVNGLIYRYRPGLDLMPGREGAFGICNFWMAEALFRSGRIEEGCKWFDSLMKKSGHSLGLWSEEIDPHSHEYLGNYPQGFSHIGLISAAVARSCLTR